MLNIYCSVDINLAVCCVISTYFGRENEISGFTWFDGHGNEFNQNHWLMIVRTPGSDVYDVLPPAEGMTECPQICQDTCITDSAEQSVQETPACNPQTEQQQADQAAGTQC